MATKGLTQLKYSENILCMINNWIEFQMSQSVTAPTTIISMIKCYNSLVYRKIISVHLHFLCEHLWQRMWNVFWRASLSIVPHLFTSFQVRNSQRFVVIALLLNRFVVSWAYIWNVNYSQRKNWHKRNNQGASVPP